MIAIKWIQMDIEDWAVNQNCDTFWIIKLKNSCVTGYFDDFDNLSDEDADHFLEYRNCYYLKGKPCTRKGGVCDCVLEEDRGTCVIDSIGIGKNIENILYLRIDLLKKIEDLEKQLKNPQKINFNGNLLG